jgi:hypothetical protein
VDRIPIGEKPTTPDNVVRLTRPDASADSDEDMSYEEAIAADAADVGEESPPTERPPGSQAVELVEQVVRVAAGIAVAGASALAEAIRATLPSESELSAQTDPAARLAGAALGAAVTSAEAAAAASKQLADTIGPALTWLAEPRVAKDASELAAGAARVLDGRWKASQAEMMDAATTFLGALLPATMKGVGGRIDLTELLRSHLDVNAIVADVDIDRIVDRLDVDSIVSRIDLDGLAERIARKVIAEDRSSGQVRDPRGRADP